MLNKNLFKFEFIPPEIRIFFFRAFLFLVLWKAAYLLVLQPTRLFDAPLTSSVGKCTAQALNFINNSHRFASGPGFSTELNQDGSSKEVVELVKNNGKNILSIADACNALELFILYLGLIWCLPAFIKRKIAYSLIGIVIIYASNIFRCIGLSLLVMYYPSAVDFAHHYLFTFIVYSIIVLLWFFYTKKLTKYGNTT